MSAPNALASTIMIIRHGEKPPEPPASPPPYGVTSDGTQDAHSLSVRGWQRAGALVSLFAPSQGTPSTVKVPEYIYAVKVDSDVESSHDAVGAKIGTKGKRAQQTIAPIAEKLRSTVKLDLTFDKGAEVAMIASAMACPGAVLICWVHENIAHIARQIPVSTATPVPEAWPNDAQGNGRFDLVWLFEYDNAVDAYRFAEIPQFLLDGDLPV